MQTVRDAWTNPAANAAPLNPAYTYLRVTHDGRSVLMVLGHVETALEGPIEVWYSARAEVLRLQNGRLKSAVGLTEEWRATRSADAPAWGAVPRDGSVRTWHRERDVMPGYRFGIRDTLALRAAPPPGKTALFGLEGASLHWFEETLIHTTAPSADTLPAARYAIDPRRPDAVIYGEQCLSARLCFAWQRWPAASAP